MSKRRTKPAKVKLARRRADFDAIRDLGLRKAMKRPGSLNPKKS